MSLVSSIYDDVFPTKTRTRGDIEFEMEQLQEDFEAEESEGGREEIYFQIGELAYELELLDKEA